MRWIVFIMCFGLQSLFSTPKVVVFDYGGVVAKVDRKPVLLFLSNSLGLPYEKIKEDFAGENLYMSFNRPKSYWEHYCKTRLSSQWMVEFEMHKREIVQPVFGMQELIESLKAQNIQVALLSNTNVHRARFLDSMGGYRFFDPVILSCFAGASKPNPTIYQVLFHALAHPPSECYFIDNKAKNIAQAKKMGMDGTVFISVEQLRRDLRQIGLVQ